MTYYSHMMIEEHRIGYPKKFRMKENLKIIEFKTFTKKFVKLTVF